MQGEHATELRDYLGVLRRRKGQIALVFAVIALVSAAIAVVLPPVYRSEATILIERQEIPPDLLDTTVTGYVQERVELITKRLFTSERLWEIAERINFYPELRAAGASGEVLQRMRDGIQITMEDVQSTKPDSGQLTLATIAFTISFEADSPEAAQKGADELAKVYLEEDRRARMQQASEVSRFLSAQARKLAGEIDDLETKLAAFKQDHVAQLPENVDLNMRLLEQAEDKLERSEARINELEERRIFLQAQLATVAPNAPVYSETGARVLSASEKLNVLRAQYLSASATYGPEHPDLARISREIQMLESQVGVRSEDEFSRTFNELAGAQSELANLRRRYSNEHPDVKKLLGTVAVLEEKMRKAGSGRTERPTPAPGTPVPDNPSYIALLSQLDAINANIRTEQNRVQLLQQKREELEKRVFVTPAVERDYLTLTRDYKNATDKYKEIREKQLKAEAAEELEQALKGQHFSLISPAFLPVAAYKPNRLAIILLGIVLGMGSGVATASVAEFLDKTVRGVRGVATVFGAPPLASIPLIKNPWDETRGRLGLASTVLLIAISSVVVLGAVHLYVMPLDGLWQDGQQSSESTGTTNSGTTNSVVNPPETRPEGE